MDSPSMIPDTPTDTDDAVYPCKGCGDILEEGKAFELAGNRWHIDCFRCNTCNTLLDSDANLLLLGDGSLICNNCTYSCSACGNKIEDLAILTGDQAFCASCFKCRNCKRKIENLRYARTSQGIFCMQCHESLMSRRRKKSKPTVSSRAASSAAPSDALSAGSSSGFEKSLPALPPPTATFNSMPDGFASPASQLSAHPTDRSPGLPTPSVPRPRDEGPATTAPDGKPWNFEDFKESLGMDDKRMSDAGDVVPIGLDLSPRVRPSPIMRSKSSDSRSNDPAAAQLAPGLQPVDSHDRLAAGPRSASSEGGPARLSPNGSLQQDSGLRILPPSDRSHTAYTSPASDYGSPTLDDRSRKQSQPTSPDNAQGDAFHLQEAPKVRRKSSGSRIGKPAANGTPPPPMALAGQTEGTPVLEQGATAPVDAASSSSKAPAIPDRSISSRRSPLSQSTSAGSPDGAAATQRDEAQRRAPPSKPAIPRKEVPRTDSDLAKNVAASRPAPSSRQGSATVPGRQMHSPQDSDSFEPPPRSSSRPTPGLTSASMRAGDKDDFTAPREAPRPPSASRHKPGESMSSMQSEHFEARDLPTPSAAQTSFDPGAGGIPTDDESRNEDDAELPGLFRKVSKAVKHGRSHSDKFNAASPKPWHRAASSSRNGSVDISSPMMNTPDAHEDATHLRNKLRFSQQRIAELESEKSTLQEQVNGTADIRQVNTELREKRTTMAFLDTQREMVIRELETMTEQLARVKETQGPIDLERLKSEALRDFAQQLHNLKDTLGGQIEELMRRKNELTGEIAGLIQMKDKGFQEYESLSTKNQGLMDHNNKLVQNIRALYSQNRGAPQGAPPLAPPPNGLGIYSTGSGTASLKDKDSFSGSLSVDATTASQLSGDTEVEAPHLVTVRKGQVKKFSWKKGTENMTKNVKRGFKGAFASNAAAAVKEDQFAESLPYGALPEGDAPTIGDRPVGQRNGAGLESMRAAASDAHRQQQQPPPPRGGAGGKVGAPLLRNVSSPLGGAGLYGTDLSIRCDLEKRMVPAIVTRCIDEVEQRGMDAEGIYRKSGSFSQVKAVQQGFEEHGDFDLSDEDLDIHAVTSALKQYLRKLPTPLIAFDCYDELLASAATSDEALRVEGVARAVSRLPESHRNTLEVLILHLARVMAQEKLNFMGANNIAVVFAPTIMRPLSIEREMADMESQRHAMHALLLHHRAIFGAGAADE